ncbi:hypothetical protein EV127DRAFT_430610 [Xylaria flabelliformis]|nr:hypothetical protein EV127DRAFT_430610 [Xylaria flabelliformis]
MAYANGTASSESRRGQTTTPSSETGLKPLVPTVLKARVTDLDFDRSVLIPYGITFDEVTFTNSFHDYFSIPRELPKGHPEHPDTYIKDLPLNICWKYDASDVQRIHRKYKMMKDDGRCEAEFQAYALAMIFRDEDAIPKDDFPTTLKFVPERMIELVHAPLGEKETPQWEAPPMLCPSEKTYAWDIRPDCAYYVSTQAFPGPLRLQCQKGISIVHKRAFGSYLSIAFKKRGQAGMATANNQIAIASTLALYNRWRLKRRKIEIMSKRESKRAAWLETDKDQLRHYCITFHGPSWNIWCTTPKTYEEWSGCTVSDLMEGDCCTISNIECFLSILNEIHRWGLLVHGQACVADLLIAAEGVEGRRLTILGTNHEEEIPEDVNRDAAGNFDGEESKENGQSDDAVSKADEQPKE